MRFYWIFGLIIVCGILAAFTINKNQPVEIHQVMQQILQQHLHSHQLNPPIMQSAIRLYIDQFDPERTYLLEGEVAKYQNLSDRDLAQIMRDYQGENYAIFQELDTVFQHSIYRARDLREKVEQEKAALFLKQAAESSSSNFPKTVGELKNNIKNDIVAFIDAAKKRYGESFIIKQPSKTIDTYEAKAREHEDQYLFVDEGGEPLPQSEQISLFSMHILKAIARSLDKHTNVLTPLEANDMMIRLEKGYPGVGIVLQQRPKGVYISSVMEQGPAARSGKVKVNDRLTAIDGVSIENRSIDDILKMLHGKKGSDVTLSLERKMKEEHRYVDKVFPVALQREYIPVNEGRVESSYETVGNGIVGKIKLNTFYRGENGVTSENDVRRAVQELDSKGNLRGLIIDLRENSGGYLTEAVKVASLFITDGVIVIAKFDNGNQQVFRDVDNHDLFNGPIVVLTSKATASAAEIVAQALQDYGVALVVGDERTYGKGTIQNQTVTQEDGTSFFKVTIGKYYTVSGKSPDQVGVKADIVVPSQFSFLNFGNEVVQNDSIPSSYKDNLTGIPQDKRDWYVHYYLPTVQPKTDIWTSLLATLKKNSNYRINKNKDYQLYLKHTDGAEADESDEESDASHDKNYGVDDLQMTEAVNIVKDMIILHQKSEAQRRNSNLAEAK